MANGTLKVQNIETSSGSGTITLGQSGETITVPNGATVSGLISNTPAFFAYRSASDSTQSIPNTTYTKILFPTELYDTAGAFASNKFVVPAGKAGYYYLQLKIRDDFSDNTTRVGAIYKNGSALIESREENHSTTRHYTHVSGVLNLAVDDYIEGFVYHSSGSSRNIDGSDTLQTSIMGYRLT